MNTRPPYREAARATWLASLALLASACWRQGGAAAGPPGAGGLPPAGLTNVAPTQTPSAVFLHEGKPFCFQGANNYYLTYRDRAMVDDVLSQANAMGVKVLRVWAFIDRGALDDSVPSVDRNDWEPYGTKQGVYFQYWDTASNTVAYNEGAENDDGLVRLDYLLATAAEHEIKLVLVLTNNWKEFGGMDQYLKWFKLDWHHQFYTDERAKQAFKRYAEHLIHRVNTLTGVAYQDDPTIFAWELANQPRCGNFGQYDRREECGPSTLTSWVREMSEHVGSLDPNHLVAVGDEGFFNRPGAVGDQYTGKDGVDHEAFLALKSIDYGTFHLYPDAWSTSMRWGDQWIVDHVAAAQRAGKPTVLEEYGIPVKRDDATGKVVSGFERRRAAYTSWNELILQRGGNAAMFWMLAGIDPSNPKTGQYPDYDHFSVYNLPEDESARLLSGYAARFHQGARACELALAHGVSGPNSPFVSVAPAPRAAAVPPPAVPPPAVP